MVNIQSILISNIAAVLMLVILLISSARVIRNRLPDTIVFNTMVGIAIAQSIIESVTFIFDGSSFRILLLVANSLLYINNIVFAFLWTVYADYKLFSDTNRIHRIYPFIALPAVFVIIASVVNLFVPVFFYITENNVYQRSSLFLIPYIISYLYLAYGVILIYTNKSKGRRYLFLPAILFMIPIVICSIAQFAFYGISVIWIGTAIALVSISINIQNEVLYTDMLSGLFTRQYLNLYLDLMIHKQLRGKMIFGIMLDIDRFKSINDNYGHLTGDDAIRQTGLMLRECTGASGIVSRFAGDEFVIISAIKNQDEISRLIQRIKDRTDEFNRTAKKPYSIVFSIGYSVYDITTDTVDSFINRIDKAMYEDKARKSGLDSAN